ncbi:NADH dehydrogenase FAD-containing subunit [Flavobacterium sp. 90]|uniref:NAD(P)/FAD-dependent oxidoreductase n=1 Tax=unclassified Flavobacterium TaxID=196869 RepID=UPI000EB41F12|nr:MULTISPECIES: FAD-dependent oxidoreductase [unclassified Flavobacterium]RKR11453.1 NADH dehydrogenase FAD-containing subunit [Flavobacterium sp. 81]TCK55234.1 NADH dehydrogenase FAD-containing subunit [Flavobacterium sp. 90]
MKKQLLIIGGGFAGFWSALSAIRQSRELQKENELEVTLVNMDEYLTIRPRLYEVSLEGLRVELKKYFKPLNIKFIIGKAEIIDPEQNLVTVATNHGSRILNYDYLILSSGSVLKAINIPGIENTFNVDTFNGAQRLEDHLSQLASKKFDGDGATTFVVAGSGLTGLEVVTVIKEKALKILREQDQKPIDFKVVLIEKADKVGNYYSAEAQDYVIKTLESKDVTIATGVSLAGVTSNGATLSDGTFIPSQTVISTVGLVASSLCNFFKGEKDKLGRLHVNKYLQLEEYDNVIAAGDVANIPIDDEGNNSLMACQFSMFLGKWAGHNAVNSLFSQPLKPYNYTDYVTCVDLGQEDGMLTTGWERTLAFSGIEGKNIKMEVTTKLIYPAEDVETALKDSFPEVPNVSQNAV